MFELLQLEGNCSTYEMILYDKIKKKRFYIKNT